MTMHVRDFREGDRSALIALWKACGLTRPWNDPHQDIDRAAQARGMSTEEVCRRHGVSSATFYKWKAKFGGMDVSDARRLKTLETENARLKKLLADSMLDVSILKDLLGKS